MRKIAAALALTAVATLTAQSPTPPPTPSGPAAEVMARYKSVQENILKAAEKMPAESYTFKPHDDTRTFARVVNHVSEAQQGSCSIYLGVQPGKVPAETATKEEVIAALKLSFAVCDKAYASLTDATLGDQITVRGNKRSKITILWGNVGHDMEQYAILSDYLRDKNLVPPTSEK